METTKNLLNTQTTTEKAKHKLIPGSFSKCYYCDVDNNLCTKYNLPRYGNVNYIGEYTWENYCLKNGGCDR